MYHILAPNIPGTVGSLNDMKFPVKSENAVCVWPYTHEEYFNQPKWFHPNIFPHQIPEVFFCFVKFTNLVSEKDKQECIGKVTYLFKQLMFLQIRIDLN